jgi:hypothetical protein
MKKLISFIIRYVPRKYLQRVANTGLKVVGVFYAGSAVTCPVCEKSFKNFCRTEGSTPGRMLCVRIAFHWNGID